MFKKSFSTPRAHRDILFFSPKNFKILLSTRIFGLSRIYFLCVACSRDQFSWFSTWCFYFTLSELLVRMGIFSLVYWSCELFVLLVCSFSCWIFCLLTFRNSLYVMDTSLVSHILCKYLLPVCGLIYHNVLASLVAQKVKNLSTMQEMGRRVWSLGQEDPVEKGMATYTSSLAWRIPWTEEPGGLQCMALQKVGHDLATEQQQYVFFCTWKRSSPLLVPEMHLTFPV